MEKVVVVENLKLSFEHSRYKGATQTEHGRTREKGGSKFWAFYDNVIIEFPLLIFWRKTHSYYNQVVIAKSLVYLYFKST